MKIVKLAALSAMVVVAAVSMAQGRGQGGMRMMGGMGGKTQLLNRDDVKKELAITSDQESKLDDLRQGQRDKMRDAMQNAGGDMEAMRETMTKMMKESEKATMAVLTPVQATRLKELWIQRTGNAVIADEEMQKELNATAEQKAKVKELQAKQQEAMMSVFEKMRNQEIDREQMQESMKKNQDVMNAELGKLLTDAQKAIIKEKSGKPFKFEETDRA